MERYKVTIRAISQIDLGGESGLNIYVLRDWQPVAAEFVCFIELPLNEVDAFDEFLEKHDHVIEHSIPSGV
jgi:hypothetical protein